MTTLQQPVTVAPEARLWPAVGKLVRLRMRLAVNAFRRAKLGAKIGYAFAALGVLAVLGIVFFLSWGLTQLVRNPEFVQVVGNTQPLLEGLPVLIVAGSFFAILLTGFGVLLQVLYLAGDMDFLLTAPLPIRAVFVSKLLQAVLPNFSIISLFALPFLFGLGYSQGYNFLYYPLVLVVLASLALAAAGLASLLVMVVVRIFPARRVAEVLGFVVATTSVICSQSGNLARTTDGFNEAQLGQVLQQLNQLSVPWSPLSWPGMSLVHIGSGRWLSGLLMLALSLGLAGLAFGFALTTAERLYYSGWASLQGVHRKKKRTPVRTAEAKANPVALLVSRWLPRPVRALLYKDYLMLRRDLRNMSQLVTPLIFGLLYGFMFLRSNGEPNLGRGEAPEFFNVAMRQAMLYGNVGISLFVSWSLLSRLAGMGFSQEGKNYWVIRTAPVHLGHLLLAKWLVAFLPSLALSWIFLVVISLLQGALSNLWFTLPAVALTIAGLTGITLGFGITGAKMDWTDPRQMNQSGGNGCAALLISLLYLLLSLLLFFGPPLLAEIFSWPVLPLQLLGLALGGLLGLAGAVLPPYLARQRVPLLGEEL